MSETMNREIVKTLDGFYMVADIVYFPEALSKKEALRSCRDFLSKEKYDIDFYRESARKVNSVQAFIDGKVGR